MKAVNSFAVLDLSFRFQEYEPDVIIIYASYNKALMEPLPHNLGL